MKKNDDIDNLLKMLNSERLEDRLTAAEILGEIGDARALQMLRERMALVSKEHYALVVAIGKLEQKLRTK